MLITFFLILKSILSCFVVFHRSSDKTGPILELRLEKKKGDQITTGDHPKRIKNKEDNFLNNLKDLHKIALNGTSVSCLLFYRGATR